MRDTAPGPARRTGSPAPVIHRGSNSWTIRPPYPERAVEDAATRLAAVPADTVRLTGREAEIVGLITAGRSNREIAEQTYLSINSVKTYVRSAYRKMGVDSRTQAVRWGMRHGLAEDQQA